MADADDFVFHMMAVMQDQGFSRQDIATALLVGSLAAAKEGCNSLDFAASLDHGAAIVRAENVSQEVH
ncbi:hypothetical protein [Rhizobium sp. PP-CC-3G-465]|uniref:hypothetical protein n=1 Tax=Rhizobium sp. PP-CC-3G-465 TaxID=2135648 RepID=UPI001053BF61|nr:hypothetical protein C8J33_1011981 [Rhizobium sp. PP-CC-3G-465]